MSGWILSEIFPSGGIWPRVIVSRYGHSPFLGISLRGLWLFWILLLGVLLEQCHWIGRHSGTAVELLPYSAWDPISILTIGAVCIEFAHSPEDRVGFLWMLRFTLTFQRLIGFCKLSRCDNCKCSGPGMWLKNSDIEFIYDMYWLALKDWKVNSLPFVDW